MNEKDMKESVFLIKAANNFEASRIEAALKDNGIPVFFKYRESGIFGVSTVVQSNLFAKGVGIDMFVPAELYERARDILIGIGAMDEQGNSIALTDISGEEGDGGESEDSEEYSEEEYRETLEYASKLIFPSWTKKFFIVILLIAVIVFLLFAVLVIVLNLADFADFLGNLVKSLTKA